MAPSLSARLPRVPGRAWLVALAAVALVGGAGVGAWRVRTLQDEARQAREHLGAAQAALSSNTGLSASAAAEQTSPQPSALGQVAVACQEASAADATLRDVSGQVQAVMPLVGALENVPGIGTQARSQSASLEAGTQLARAGAALCSGLGPLTELLTGSESSGGDQSATQLLRSLVLARPKLGEALDQFERLQTSLSAIQDTDLDESSRAGVVALRSRLPRLTNTLREATVLLDLLGANGPHRYLLVSQNPDELRATGGYIGSAGVVEVSAGTIRLTEYGSSRAYDTPPDMRVVPPEAFQQYLGAGYWELAAANWWPSFPDAARQLMYLYGLSHPDQPLDGVVALDQFGMQRVLEVVGPVDVPEYGERVTADDVQAKLDQYVHVVTDETDRKQFTTALSTAVLRRVLTAPRGVLPALVRAVQRSLDEQHLLVWTTQPGAGDLLASHHWDGALLPAQGDALMLVDTDVAGTKQSQEITRDADYHVNLSQPDAPLARLEITYTNESSPDRRHGAEFVRNYRTFLRVFVPQGAQLLPDASGGFNGGVTSGNECGRGYFAGEVTIPEGEKVTVSLAYRLPGRVVTDGAYDLLVQQQPGLPAGHVAVSVDSPSGSAQEQIDNAGGQHVHWRVVGSQVDSLPLPVASGDGCGLAPVEAQPIVAPTRITIPTANIASDIVDLGVGSDGVMEVPPTPDVVGWYRMSARAGQPGNSVMSGHVDWAQKPAVFWGLRSLRPGDDIDVQGADGVVHHYAVEWNKTFEADSAPVEDLVGGTRDAVLTLITCDGAFDRAHGLYLDRRIVRARLTD